MKKNKIFLIILLFFTILLFKNNSLVQENILIACNLFIKKIFPSLFPMFILCDLLIYVGLPELLCQVFGNLFSKIFHTSPYGAFAFFISLFSGTPANAYIMKNLVDQKKLSSQEASYIFSFSFFTNPLFYFTMLNFIFPGNQKIILKLFLAPYFSNFLLGMLLRPKDFKKEQITFQPSKENATTILIKSIQKSMNTLLMILGAITFFFIINALCNPKNIPFFSGIFEVSQGLNALGLSNLPLKIKELWTLLFVSFGGLSILLQIKSILNNTSISLTPFIKVRLLQCLLSFGWILF